MTKKGVYISMEILRIKNLTMTEKAILSLVTNFKHKGCFQSNKTLAGFLGCGVTTIKSSIKNLKSKGYIEDIEPKKLKRCLKANRPESALSEEELPGRNLASGRSESDPGQAGKRPIEGPEFDPTTERKGERKSKENPKVKSEHDSEALRLAQILLDSIHSRKPDFKKPNLSRWTKDISLMLRRDNRKSERIEKVIKWSQADPFWQNNILSGEKLREHFDRLEMLMDNRNGRSTAYSRDFSRQESAIGTFIR